jgi:hypothetical protein
MRAAFAVLVSLVALGAFVSGCGDDSEESCHPATESIKTGTFSCMEFCELSNFESGEERHNGCLVECECSGGTGSFDMDNDCFGYCDAYDIVDPEAWMIVNDNTCACDRTEVPEDEESGGRS